MKTSALAVASAIVSIGCAFGETYTWNGSGNTWNSDGSWTPTGIPNAGDVAVFNANAEITDAIELGEGTLTISNAVSTTLSLKGVISGAGGIFKGGDGYLKLYGDNTFTGMFVSDGTGKGNSDPRDSSCVTIYHPHALGAGEAKFDPNYDYGRGSRLFIDGSFVQDYTIEIPVTVSGDQPSAYCVILQNGCAKVTFKEIVKSKCRLSVKPASSSDHVTVVFEKGYDAGNYNFFKYGDYHFKGPVNGTFYPSGEEQTVYLYSDANTYGNMTFGADVVLMTANALRSSGNASYTFNYETGRICLNGFDQTIGQLNTPFTEPAGKSKHGFYSPEDKPAVLHMAGGIVTIPGFHGVFTGAAGLEWAPTDAANEFVFSDTVQSTKGEFIAATGAIRFKSGAGVSVLGKLSIAATGKVVVESSAGSMIVSNVTVAAGGRIDLAGGKQIVCRSLVVNGVEKPVGDYTTANLPDVIEGAGLIVVNPYADNAWKGGSVGLWGEDANWALGHVPGGQENAVIDGKVKVLVTVDTAAVHEFRMDGGAALVFSNGWDACVNADSVSLVNGTVSCAGPFSNALQKCRVHFKCRRFDLGTAAKIDVNGRGWMGGTYARIWGDWDSDANKNYKTKQKNDDGVDCGGWGPGHANNYSGASHFGYGASHCSPSSGSGSVFSTTMSALYDDPFAPMEPGSGGMGLNGSAYGVIYGDPENIVVCPNGGGAVLIEATGPVTVNGQILADGVGAFIGNFYYCNNPNLTSSGGSGGSVRIIGSTFAGTGTIRANGGNGGHSVPAPEVNPENGMTSTGGAGGGGGIAITYDPQLQVTGACVGMTISAGAGTYPDMPLQSGAKRTERLDYATMEKYRRDAEPGTLYFTDRKIIDDTIGRGLTGKLFAVPGYTYDGNLDWTWGNVRFGATGAVFAVTGNLTLSGSWSRLDIGGTTKVLQGCTRVYVSTIAEPVKLEVGGDLTVADGAALAVYAADTAGADGWGAEVDVAGAFTVAAGGLVYPTADYKTGVAPRFLVGSLAVEEGGHIDADHRGFSGAPGGGEYPPGVQQTVGFGPGGGSGAGTAGQGAGFGGLGGLAFWEGTCTTENKDSERGKTYGDAYLPVLAGSGGGCGGWEWGGDGGGVVNITAAGSVSIAGTVSADGSYSEYGGDNHHGGAGSGGSVVLCGATVTGTATARVSARGGDSPIIKASPTPAAGGGGRIALWSGNDLTVAGQKTSRRHADDPGAAVFGGKMSWLGVLDANGGTNVLKVASEKAAAVIESSWGRPGTVTYNCFTEAPGALFFLR